MCGFAGVIAFDERARVSRERLGAMSAAVAHRGPDGEAIWESGGAGQRAWAGLAFRRLAVIDPDPRSMQPFHVGGKTILFNGEIYNYRELRKELEGIRPEYAWRTSGDTEVLLLAIDTWGEGAIAKLNGMFALAVWDAPRHTLLLARDRMGQKPLYYARTDGGIAIGSELPAVLASGLVSADIDRSSLHGYLQLGYMHAPATIYRGIRQLPPGGLMMVDANGAVERSYWTLPTSPGRWSDPDALTQTRGRVLEAVRRQLVADVPLGCFLSGGIDSSVVSLAMAKAVGDPSRVRTFSIGFDDPRYDESGHAQEVARHLGTTHRMFRVTPDAAADLPKLAGAFGEPFADSSALPTHYLSQQTRQHVTVALSGDGGDELFGGYDRYRAMKLDAALQRMPRKLRTLIASGWAGHPAAGHPKSLRARAGRFLGSIDQPPAGRYAGYVRLFGERQLRELLPEGTPVAADVVSAMFPAGDPVEAALAVDRRTYLPGDLLTKVDRCSMLHALEVRSPFMDHELVEMAAGLTSDQLLRGGGKRMLREAFADELPAAVFKRRKMGFAVPIGEWFRTDPQLRAMLHDHLFAADSFATSHFHPQTVHKLVDEHETGRVDHSQRLYALLMLELWWQTQR